MNYNTTDGNEEIQGIDLIVNTDNSIRRIDWRAFVTRNDSTFKENYSWLPNKQFNIVRTYEGTATKPHIEEVYVYWNKK